MKEYTTDTLIIGAGPAGMAAAAFLAQAKKDFLIVERAAAVGGLAKTYAFKEGDLVFYSDNGPHRFFSKNPYLYTFIEDLLEERWIKVVRKTRQFIDGKFYDYPIDALQALRNIGILRAIRMLLDYVWAKIVYGVFKKKVVTFEDMALSKFGRSLAELNIINYTEKIWGIPVSRIHPDWAEQRIKGLDLSSAAKDAFSRLFKNNSAYSGAKPKTLVDAFYYPEEGTGLIYETIKNQIERAGYSVLLNTEPVSIRHRSGQIYEVVIRGPEGEAAVRCNNLIESVPITEFVKLLDPQAPEEVLEANSGLTHRSQVYLFITLDKESVTDDQWIYFPNIEVPIGRISEMRNFSPKMSPSGKTSIFVEFFCDEGDVVWNMSADELYNLAIPYFEKWGLFTRREVRAYYQIKQKNVYPVYDLEYPERLSVIKQYLDSFKNLYYIGRPGRFRYNNQDHSLEMGMLAAKSIIDGVRYDIEAVGSEKEYYESGSLYEQPKRKT